MAEKVKIKTSQLHTWMLSGMLFNMPDPAQSRFVNAEPCYRWDDKRLACLINSYQKHLEVGTLMTQEIAHMRYVVSHSQSHVTKQPVRTTEQLLRTQKEQAEWRKIKL